MSLKFGGFTSDGVPRVIRTTEVFGLTPLGKQKAEAFAHEGPRFDILQAFSEGGPSSLGELAEAAHMSPNKVRHIVRSMIRNGYVKKMD